jgi:uncharacterized membrane protein YqhA
MVGLFTVTRIIVGLAVIGIFVGSTVMMLLGVFGVLVVVYTALTEAGSGILDELRIALIEATDLFLVSTTLYVIAAGLFQLFVNPNVGRHFPPWLRIGELHALEDRMIGMVVAVSCVVFLTLLLEWHGQFDILAAGVGIGAVIAAASLFVYASARRHKLSNDEHEDDEQDR